MAWIKSGDPTAVGDLGFGGIFYPSSFDLSFASSLEYNVAIVAQVGAGFIKSDGTKHIEPQIFTFTQELITSKQLEVQKIESAHNIADLLTRLSWPTPTATLSSKLE